MDGIGPPSTNERGDGSRHSHTRQVGAVGIPRAEGSLSEWEQFGILYLIDSSGVLGTRALPDRNHGGSR